jgi:hypothetical protein
MTFNAAFLDRIERIPLFKRDTAVAIDTFDHIQLAARSLFDPDPSLSLDQSLDGDMAGLATDVLDLFPMMTVRTGFLKSLSMAGPRRVTIRTLQPVARDMGLMRKLHIVKGNGPPLHSHMAKCGAGHPGLNFPRSIALVKHGEGLFCLIICRIEKLKGILDIMDPLAKKNKAIVVTSFVKQVPSLPEISRSSSILLKLIEYLLDIKNPLIGVVLCP